jgi:calpain
VPVFVDTLIPFDSTTKQIAYGSCSEPSEFWVPLMEKAYAKLHGSYEALNGGSLAEGMVDLTGGVSVKYDLTQPEIKQAIDSGQLWKDMRKWNQLGYLIGYSLSVKDESGNPADGVNAQGIIQNHAYGMLRIEDLTQQYGLQMLFTRNPWGT